MKQSVFTLICKRDVKMALITLPKIYNFLEDPNDFYIMDDGSLNQSEVNLLKYEMPLATIILRSEREEQILKKLKNYPNCLKYRAEHPLGFKLLDVPILAEQITKRFTFTDCDIIYLKNCEKYFTQNINTHLTTDAIKLSIKLKHGLLKFNWKIPYQFNSGYFSFGIIDYDLDFIEYYLGLNEVKYVPWLIEQTCWGLLFSRSGISVAPLKNQFVCQEDFLGPKDETLAIHLIADLKKNYIDWAKNKKQESTKLFLPIFNNSRNVNYYDWFKKIMKRLLI